VKLLLVNPDLTVSDTRSNVRALVELLADFRGELAEHDLWLLPEHFHFGPAEAYLDDLHELSRDAGCHVVGGSRHEPTRSGAVNTGVVMAPDGSIVHRYDKLRPYAEERQWVEPGTRTGGFVHQGRRVGVLICADFWFTDPFLEQDAPPDLLLVPALSVTRKPAPDYSRALWRHTAVTRAYEYAVYVGISDWSGNSRLPSLRTSGVSGFADPTVVEPELLFRPVSRAALVELDFEALDAFRADRRARGFLWGGAG
jgi:predicted amidohydrolase